MWRHGVEAEDLRSALYGVRHGSLSTSSNHRSVAAEGAGAVGTEAAVEGAGATEAVAEGAGATQAAAECVDAVVTEVAAEGAGVGATDVARSANH